MGAFPPGRTAGPHRGLCRAPETRCALRADGLSADDDLHAPGGFGKTALLGRRCRALREEGMAVAWLSLDEEDGPETTATYLALAFERAGVGSFQAGEGRAGVEPAAAVDPVADSKARYRLNLLVHALERHGAPCVLALDEVERLRNPRAVAVLNALLRGAPSNLRVGMAYRERPPGLEVAQMELEGRAVTVTVDDLRFSKQDASRLFERRLSRRELDLLVTRSAGWPIALRIYGNATHQGETSTGADDPDDLAAGWIETRLLRGVSEDDREFVLDVALLDRIEPDLVEEAVGVRNAGRRLGSMGALAGLFSTTGGRGSGLRLHPLVRGYCEKQRFTEAPDRFRTLHRAFAEALARRGRTLEALRHAAEAGDGDLVGRLAERTGGLKLWLEEGIEALRMLDSVLGEDVLSRFPRLALLRCIALTFSGDIEAANRVYRETSSRTAGFSRDREGGDDEALMIDKLLVRGAAEMLGCKPYGEPIAEMLPIGIEVIEGLAAAPLFRGLMSLGICMMQNQKAAFDEALEWSERARDELGRDSPYLAHVDFQRGSVAMATGRAAEAEQCYGRALRVARASHLRDAGALMLEQVLSAELSLERTAGAVDVRGAPLTPWVLGECGAWLDIYAANAEVRAELALLRDGAPAALDVVDQARDYARRTERPPLVRLLSALRVSVLVDSGDVPGAGMAWRFARLPEDPLECVDIETQGWREAEMLSCARLRLLTARDDYQAGRELARTLLALARERQLVRTEMRALALAMALEHRAGDDDRAKAHLVAYLLRFQSAGYARPLAREREIALALLGEVARESDAHGTVGRTAAALREAMQESPDAALNRPHPPLTEREFEVLVRLETQRDKDIARSLGLSYDGLRYRVQRIFTKLGARSRLDAVHRARAQGILPPIEG